MQATTLSTHYTGQSIEKAGQIIIIFNIEYANVCLVRSTVIKSTGINGHVDVTSRFCIFVGST